MTAAGLTLRVYVCTSVFASATSFLSLLLITSTFAVPRNSQPKFLVVFLGVLCACNIRSTTSRGGGGGQETASNLGRVSRHFVASVRGKVTSGARHLAGKLERSSSDVTCIICDFAVDNFLY